MAGRNQDLFSKLLDRSFPGASRVVKVIDGLGDRIDDLQKKVEGLDGAVDRKVDDLERRLDRLDRLGKSGQRRARAAEEPAAPAAEPTEPDAGERPSPPGADAA